MYPSSTLNRCHICFRFKPLSHVRLLGTTWTVAHQAPLSIGFFRQELWSGLPFPSPGDLPDPGIKLASPVLQADSLPAESMGKIESAIGIHMLPPS